MLIIDKYAYTNRLSKVNPNKKVAIGAIFLIASMVIKNVFILSGIMILMSILVVCVAGIDLKNYLKLLQIPMYFLFLSIGITLVNISFNKADLLYSFQFFSFYIGISKASIDMSIHVLFRAMSCLTCVYFCILTTPFNQLIFFFKKLHLPDTFVELSMLIYRFIFIFLEEFSEIYKSQELRFGYINLKTSYKSLGILGSMLYKRLMTRYDDMCISLDIKLYDGKFHIVGDNDV